MTASVTSIDTSALKQMTQRNTSTSSLSTMAPITFKVLALPPIAGFDSNPLYHECGQTKEGHIYITMGNNSGLKIYQYNIKTNEWREFYDFGYAVQCSFIGNAVDSLNDQLYVISKCTHSLRTVLCGLNLNTKQFIFKNVIKKQMETSFHDSQHLLVSIPNRRDLKDPDMDSRLIDSELHLLYSSSINHIRIHINPSHFASQCKEYDGISAIDRLRCAKSIYVPSVGRIFVFGGKPSVNEDGINCHKGKKENIYKEIEIQSNDTYYTSEPVSNSIWYCDVRNQRQKDYQWCVYKQRLPHATSNYGILNAFQYLIFFFYYKTNNDIWCLDLLTGAMVKCNHVFPLNCFDEMRMISTVRNHAHFMLVNKDYGWLRCRMYGFKRYVNKLTGETIWNEPKIWMDWDEDDGETNIDPSKRRNFHISIDLLDVVPHIIRQRHQKRYFELITGLIVQAYVDRDLINNRFAVDLIHLIGHFTSRLYYRYDDM